MSEVKYGTIAIIILSAALVALPFGERRLGRRDHNRGLGLPHVVLVQTV